MGAGGMYLGPERPRLYENLLPAAVHLVERPDLRHPAVDLALWRIRRRRRVRQPLFSRTRREDRPGTRLRSPLGDLSGLCRSFERATVLAWLAASHRG